MRILHVYNRHRGAGGADDAWDATIRVSRERGLDVVEFARDSNDIPLTIGGKASAFINGVYARRGVADFTRALAELRPDVVHAHELFPLISPWILPRCADAGVPVVMTCYDFRLTCPIATHYRDGAVCHKCLGGREGWAVVHNCRGNLAESLAFGLRSAVADRFGLFRDHIARFIVLSDFSARFLEEHAGVAAERTALIPCTIPMPESIVADPSAGAYIAFAGRLAPEKGVPVLIEAARLARLPLRVAVSAAHTPPDAAVEGAALVRTRSKEELAQFYRGARMLVVPSVWYETFGLVAAEAMSHGVPVVVSRIGAIQEAIVDGESGLRFEPGDARDLAEKMTRIWDDPALCRSMGRAAAARAEARCAANAHVDRLLRVYNAVLEP